MKAKALILENSYLKAVSKKSKKRGEEEEMKLQLDMYRATEDKNITNEMSLTAMEGQKGIPKTNHL